MMNLVPGVVASILAIILAWLATKVAWPHFQDRIFYKGVRVDGVWDICDVRDGSERKTGSLTLRQQGSKVTGTSHRIQTRDGQNSDRRFTYTGRIAGEQLTLVFEDQRGRDFDTGTYVFRVQNNYVEMVGMTTFHGKRENKIIAESRILRKTASPLPQHQ